MGHLSTPVYKIWKKSAICIYVFFRANSRTDGRTDGRTAPYHKDGRIKNGKKSKKKKKKKNGLASMLAEGN